jgi:hypothetical protein
MHRVDSNGHVGNMFDNGDPGVPRQPTAVEAPWFNDVQETLAQFIESTGITLVKGTYTQLTAAVTAAIATAATALKAAANTWALRQTYSDGVLVSAPATANRAGVVASGNGTGAAFDGGSGFVKAENAPKVEFTIKALSNGVGVAFTLATVRGFNIGTPTRISQFIIRVPFTVPFANTDQVALLFNPYNQVSGSATGTQSPKVIAYNTNYIEFDLWNQGTAAPVDLDGQATGGTNTYWLFSGAIYGAQ